ncbi:hypothetical protein CKO35_16740 [Ectothiorhodospira shaposhnikovii]|uniref:DUF2442 domain-containing protein n=1 Tax=Ectothiorhodospira shaposhnikovii TaxID=1054 RepID=UPI001F5BCE9B|nr:DUF2442 domain-containing protein [Ectothiorhodospira shaposhnikovii]MBK1674902.1 hypothetical protein [Ectothiorhodospira shaposhnikovii]
MAMTELDIEQANSRMENLRQSGHAVAARYDQQRDRVIISLQTGVEITFPPSLAEGLSGATAQELEIIEITPSGLGLHWPHLDADVYVPSILQGIFGSRRWMARQLGAQGGKNCSDRKAAASRENGKLGGRPRKQA